MEVYVSDLHSLYSSCSTILNDHLVDLGVASQVQVRMNGPSGVDICMSAITPAASLCWYC